MNENEKDIVQRILVQLEPELAKEAIKIFAKYDEYKRLEEDFGIDLVTLSKASKQRHIFVKNAFGEINSREIYSIDFYAKIIVYYLEYQPERQLMHQPLNMHGKTWALTKEELI